MYNLSFKDIMNNIIYHFKSTPGYTRDLFLGRDIDDSFTILLDESYPYYCDGIRGLEVNYSKYINNHGHVSYNAPDIKLYVDLSFFMYHSLKEVNINIPIVIHVISNELQLSNISIHLSMYTSYMCVLYFDILMKGNILSVSEEYFRLLLVSRDDVVYNSYDNWLRSGIEIV